MKTNYRSECEGNMAYNKIIKIGSQEISQESKVFIIAEAGVNHNGDMKIAKQLIDVAVNAKVDAIKFQAFKTEELILKNVEKADYQKKTTANEETQYEMLKKLELNKNQTREIKDYCDEQGIMFLTTPFDEKSLAELDELDLPAYKISSTDANNIMFLRKVASKNKPIILSTGMSYLEETRKVLEEIASINNNLIILHCSANYPVMADEVNLNVLDDMKEKLDILIGYSDHTKGIGAGPYAVAKGAKIVEKHFTLDCDLDGPDHEASLNPNQLKIFVEEIRKVEQYLGNAIKIPTISEIENRKKMQKFFVASKNIFKGEVFNSENIVAKRTGGLGISALYYKEVLNKQAKKDFSLNDIITI